MSDDRVLWERITLPAYVDLINDAFRRASKGMEIRLLKGHKTAAGDMCVVLSVGERWGSAIWFEAVFTPIDAAYVPQADDEFLAVSRFAADHDRIEHHAYSGEFTFSLQIIESELDTPAIIADQLLAWWREAEAQERSEIFYRALPQELQDGIGYFVDEPVKRLDFARTRDRLDYQVYRALAEQGLVRTTSSFMSNSGSASLTERGAQIVRYLTLLRKRQVKLEQKETDDAP